MTTQEKAQAFRSYLSAIVTGWTACDHSIVRLTTEHIKDAAEIAEQCVEVEWEYLKAEWTKE